MSIDYIAVLDRGHLDNGLFLTTFAKSIANHSHRGLIIHSDSEYTDRIMQTGVMREAAKKRAIKDLNHRLIALLADQGVSAIGLNGYQKKLLTISDGKVSVDVDQIEILPKQPVLLISALVHSSDKAEPVPATLQEVTEALRSSLKIKEIFLFTKSDEDQLIKKDLPPTLEDISDKESFINDTVPDEFRERHAGITLTTVNDFRSYPEIKNKTRL